MPGKKQIEYVIKPDGTVEERVSGIDGPDCEKVTEAIEKALGEVVEREHTSDYYESGQSTGDTQSLLLPP